MLCIKDLTSSQSKQYSLAAEVCRQGGVSGAVANHIAGREIVLAGEIFAEHPGAGLAGGQIVGGEAAVYEDIVKHDTFALQRLQHQILRPYEIFVGKGIGAQAVLIAGQNQFIAQIHKAFEARDSPGDELELLKRIHLLTRHRLHQYGAVAVYEECFLKTHSCILFFPFSHSRKECPQ